jgi:hypothetical protein
MKQAVVYLSVSLLVLFWGGGFWAGDSLEVNIWNGATPRMEILLWLATCLTFVAATRCFSSYRSFAIQFAQSVWRDFSVHLVDYESTNYQGTARDDANDNDEDA